MTSKTLVTETTANPMVLDQPDRSDRPDQAGGPEIAPAGAAITRAAGIVSLGNVLSSGLGLVRETVKSGLFGASGFVSAYNVAAIVPSMLFDLLVGGLVSSALVPLLSELAAKKDRGELWHLLSLFLSVALVGLSVAVLLMELFAPTVARLLADGLDESLLQVTTDLLRITVPAVLFLSLSSVLSGALYALKRFAFPAFSLPLYNASMIVVALLLADRFGIAAMALGLLVGSILQVAFQLPGLRAATLRWRFDLHDPALRKMWKLYRPVLSGLIVGQIAIAISLNLASRTSPEGIALMDYPTRLIQFPLGLIVSAVSIAILPSLSRHAAADAPAEFRATLAQGLRLVIVLIIPAAVGLFVLAPDIVGLVYEHGAFTSADTQAVTLMLWLYLIGLIFAGIDQPLVFAFYARQDTLTPATVGLICNVGIYLLMAIVPPALSNRALQITDLAIANSVQWMSHALIMLWLLRYRLGGVGGHGLGRLALKAAIASLAMALGAWLASRGLIAALDTPGSAPSIVTEAIVVGGAALIGLAIYLSAMLLMRAQEVRAIGRLLLRPLSLLRRRVA